MLTSYDLNTVTVDDIQRPKANWELRLKGLGSGSAGMPPTVDGLAGWCARAGRAAAAAAQRAATTRAPQQYCAGGGRGHTAFVC